MPLEFYHPFDNLYFNDLTCFLSGVDLEEIDDKITVFPDWLLDKYNYRERKFTLMDTVNATTYGELKLPCSKKVKFAFEKLDEEVKLAFEGGYEEIKSLDEQKLFLWIGRIIYGVLYYEMEQEKMRMERRDREFGMSPILRKRYGMFHLMLQSLISPIYFQGKKPWSISIVQLKYSQEVFNHRDDAINLLFSLGVNGFGIIACLQDNGEITAENKNILDKIEGKVLHPIQFEELCARFLYLDYLKQAEADFDLKLTENQLIIEALPLKAPFNKSTFAPWDNNMFEQVLEDYWSPWGLTKKEIMKESSFPISFLEEPYTFEFIDPDSISLPY